MKITNQQTQDAFSIIGQLGALSATEGIDKGNKETANKIIEDLLSKIIKPAVQDMTAQASGLIVK